MRITNLGRVACLLVLLAVSLVLVCGGCEQRDPKVMVTPFVAKAPQSPPASQPAGVLRAQPCTTAYEQAVMGK